MKPSSSLPIPWYSIVLHLRLSITSTVLSAVSKEKREHVTHLKTSRSSAAAVLGVSFISVAYMNLNSSKSMRELLSKSNLSRHSCRNASDGKKPNAFKAQRTSSIEIWVQKEIIFNKKGCKPRPNHPCRSIQMYFVVLPTSFRRSVH